MPMFMPGRMQMFMPGRVKKLFTGDHKEKAATCEYIEVVVPGEASSLAGTVAVVNSVLRHTNQSVRFHLVVPHQTVTILRQWLDGIPDSRLHYQIIAFPERLLKLANNDVESAQVFLAGILPTNITGRVIFISNDAIVQGDIAELQQVPIAVHSFGAFLLDSQSETHADLADKPLYSQQVNMMNRFVHKRHIKGTRVTFSGGVFVANMKYWRHTHAHRSLVAWLNIHKRMSIVGASPSATAHRAAMLLTFYGRVSVLPPKWHLRGLGVSEATPYSESFVRSHKVIRWSGHLKPWMPNTPYRNLWLEYAVPDPIRKP
ncbi:glycosyltransferase 8 domain-containing protein 1-like [Amphibalanus amphitrite]|uniref:glycosyltransferase 8 domain-containing protein 1-like n=1 Tax=Amphibalanus amphitrite TaxID=1232801 RepID=UPI001C8FD036|nr:glycosyltransferase 8 domain-containing protein 1-like [Amphibalanus amphitrite]